MKELNIAKVIVENRRKKGLTQDELAAYMGVSKASVSKWETGQCYPDIIFLPILATYFNISIDKLIGYEPQLTKEDIKKLYVELAEKFAEKPFLEAWEECQEIVKKYYSCSSLLLQMTGLYINHHMLAPKPELGQKMLEEALKLCHRIKEESKEVAEIQEAHHLEGIIYLMQGKPTEVLELFGEELHPIYSEEPCIAQAWQMLGNQENAIKTLQVGIYQNLLLVINAMPQLLMLHTGTPDKIEEILRRALEIEKVFDLNHLNPNGMLQIYLTAAKIYAHQGQTEQVLTYLKQYVEVGKFLFPCTLHGDDYFDKLDDWFQEFVLGSQAPRNEKVIKQSMIGGLVATPEFAYLKEDEEFQALVRQLHFILGVE